MAVVKNCRIIDSRTTTTDLDVAPERKLGPNQIAWLEEKIPIVKHCADAVANRDATAAEAEKLANG